MEDVLAALIVLIAAATPFLVMAAFFLVPLLLMGGGVFLFLYIARRANSPDPAEKLPDGVQDALEFKSRHVRGQDPQAEAWRAAGEQLGLAFTPPNETWSSYGGCVLEGEVDGRAVRVDTREWGNLRYTVTRVAVDPDFGLPDDLDAVLTQETKQGVALVAHAPTLKVEDGDVVHDAVGIRDSDADIMAVVRALVALAGPPA